MKCWWSVSITLAFIGLTGSSAPIVAETNTSSSGSDKCIACHGKSGLGAGIVGQWRGSKHSHSGVACLECHTAATARPDSFTHYGSKIVTIVTPNDCGTCHQQESREFQASRHSEAARFVGSLDNTLGEVVEGTAAATSGCQQCHGSTVSVSANGRLNPSTWPNTGIGRVNPDGSRGSCTACHGRHAFSAAQARMPENCGRCHMGPDHPQIEIYNESKHGIAFAAWRNSGTMNLDSSSWVVGRDYVAAPTCATCHMSATPNRPVTHDVGSRISWTLRPIISARLADSEAKRAAMQDVCSQCHAREFVGGFYTQYDEAVNLYNEKFARPAQTIMAGLRSRKLITPTPFDDKIEWIFYELWHHEGRRARMGASMMGPDYTQWHGFYEVAKHFYTEFIPEVRRLGADDLADSALASPYHRWTGGMSDTDIQNQVRFYRERYGH